VLRLFRVLVIGLAALFLLPPATSWADAPGPTDYRSSVRSIEPATPTIHPSVVGGDSFLLLEVDEGVTVEVIGYQGESFLRFEADGAVFENRTSPTYAASRSRYDGSLPEGFDVNADPEWRKVSSDGSYAWHDHRIHWMTEVRPPGKRPGDVILRSVIPMVVDGVEVSVTVESVWMPAASLLPVWLGAGAGLAAALAAGLLRKARWAGLLLVDLAVLATVVGWWQYASFPSETGPRPAWLLLPLVATIAAVAAAGIRLRGRPGLYAAALVTLSGVNLLLWAWMRRDGFSRAILPTHAPGWLDRFATSAALAGGPVMAAFGLAALVAAVVAPAATPSP
jgi:hypothetical protein